MTCLTALLACLVGVVVVLRDDSPAAAAAESYGLWESDVVPTVFADSDRRAVTLSTVFSVDEPGMVAAVQFYRVEANKGPHQVSLSVLEGRRLATSSVADSLQPGWVTAVLDEPVALEPGEYYTASYRAPQGRYSLATDSVSWESPVRSGAITAWQGRYRYAGEPTQDAWRDSTYFVGPVFSPSGDDAGAGAVARPSAAPEPELRGDWPGPGDTGVPDGVELRPYTGPTTITESGTVIDAQLVEGSLVIDAPDVVISRSRVNGAIDADSGDASVRIVDSEVDGGPGPAPAIGYQHVTVLRSEVVGGQHSVACGGDCVVRDSWLHDQSLPAGEEYHNNAFISNGGSAMVITGNRLACTPPDNAAGGGCSTNLSLFGDFAPISDVTITDNVFEATPGGFCGSFGSNEGKNFGRQSAGIAVTDNVFQRGEGRCGVFGPVTGYAGGPGSEWRDNRWFDGGVVAPAG